MTKLTTAIRERITADLLKHRFSKAADKLAKDRAAFALRVYNDLYGAAVRKRMAELPDGWLPTMDHIEARFGTDYDSIGFNGSIYGPVSAQFSKPLDLVSRRMQSAHARSCVRVYEATHPLAIAHAELQRRASELRSAIEQAKRQATSALNSAGSIGRLVEAWPEIEPFAKKHAAVPAQLPALPTADLNKLLDLPVAA